MKRYFTLTVLFSAAVLFIPAVPVCCVHGDTEKAVTEAAFSTAKTEAPEEKSSVEAAEKESTAAEMIPYKVLDVSTGEVIEVPVRDYVIGAVCAEMPATFEPEALKAQAVAAHTYAERQRLREKENPTPELCGADFSNDTSKYQGYYTESQAKQFFGDSYEDSYSKISKAADEVMCFILTYEDEPIISAFHSMSSGKTESAENAWGAPVDYLVPVDSSYDTAAPKYMEEVRYGKELLREKLSAAFGDISLGDDFTQWLTVSEVSESGTVLKAAAGDKTVTGNDIRTALSLRSPSFEVKYEGDEAVITTKGYGHGVGMSQYGADSMAAEGKTWREILEHYYPGCKIEERS